MFVKIDIDTKYITKVELTPEDVSGILYDLGRLDKDTLMESTRKLSSALKTAEICIQHDGEASIITEDGYGN